MTEKVCRRCGVTRPLSEFPPNSRMCDGRSSWCTDCKNAGTRQWRASRRDTYNAARRVHYEPRACFGCGFVESPNRKDRRYCCRLCRDHLRDYGLEATDSIAVAWFAVHRQHHEVVVRP
jgi:hypothetical protein